MREVKEICHPNTKNQADEIW